MKLGSVKRVVGVRDDPVFDMIDRLSQNSSKERTIQLEWNMMPRLNTRHRCGDLLQRARIGCAQSERDIDSGIDEDSWNLPKESWPVLVRSPEKASCASASRQSVTSALRNMAKVPFNVTGDAGSSHSDCKIGCHCDATMATRTGEQNLKFLARPSKPS